MLSRAIRPLTTRTTCLVTTPIRSNTFCGPFCIRTIASAVGLAPAEPTPISITTSGQTPALSQRGLTQKGDNLPYFVSRNFVGNLGVYGKAVSAGTRRFTLIKRLEGDVTVFKKDIQKALKLREEDVQYNQRTGHIRIKVSGSIGLGRPRYADHRFTPGPLSSANHSFPHGPGLLRYGDGRRRNTTRRGCHPRYLL